MRTLAFIVMLRFDPCGVQVTPSGELYPANVLPVRTIFSQTGLVKPETVTLAVLPAVALRLRR
jgi:hypothetical protein